MDFIVNDLKYYKDKIEFKTYAEWVEYSKRNPLRSYKIDKKISKKRRC